MGRIIDQLFGRDRAAPPAFPEIAVLRGYWEGLRAGGEVPARAALDPRGIADILDRVFVLERVAPGQARFRIAGMHLADLMGMEVQGMPLMSLFIPEDRLGLAAVLEQVFAGPGMVDLVLEAERGLGRPALAARMVILPLRDEAGRVARAVGVIATEGAAGRAPRRFAIARRVVTPLVPAAPAPVAAELAEPPAPYLPPRARPGRGHLRLVQFD